MRRAQVAEHDVAACKRAVASGAGDDVPVRRRQVSELVTAEMAGARKGAMALMACLRLLALALEE